jgi:hypothetical protein
MLHARRSIWKAAKKALADGTWAIHKFMIDKCQFLLAAINEGACSFHNCLSSIITLHAVFPDSNIIVCQFHIVQAIIRFDGDDGRVTGGPKIPYALKYHMLRFFREAQRCRIREQWEAYEVRFFQQLERLCMSGDTDTAVENPEDSYESDDGSIPTMPTMSHTGPNEEVRRARYIFLHNYFKKNFFTKVWLCEFFLAAYITT